MGNSAASACANFVIKKAAEEQKRQNRRGLARDWDSDAMRRTTNSEEVRLQKISQIPSPCSSAACNWPTSDFLGVNLHAISRDLKEKTELVKDSVYELVREDNPDVEFIFFHGLQPDPEDTTHAFWRTWKMRFTEECWLTSLLSQLLNYTDREIKPRVLSVTYENSSKLRGIRSWLGSSIDHFDTSEKLITDLVLRGRGGVGQRHNVPVILVGHDLGGIMIKHFLMKVKTKLTADNLEPVMRRRIKFFWDNVSALVFYATPPVEYPLMSEKLPPHSNSPSLQFLTALGKDAARVNKQFESFSKFRNPKFKIPMLRIWESAKTTQGRFRNELVVPKYVQQTSDDHYTGLWEDHFQLCQPTGVHSFTARRFARFVVQLIEDLREDEHFV
ncbi:hypothetical protein R1flu_014844 [Riccia fluitans]|uniref:Uncharacterized protein n=1 Tax=Riccia fluitans TaxID=41844 RepID=A0ABD1YHM6_9MARC